MDEAIDQHAWHGTIREFCLWCAGRNTTPRYSGAVELTDEERVERVQACGHDRCPLWPYRMGPRLQ